MNYKTPKGTIDYFGDSAKKLNYIIDVVRQIFVKNGAEYLETPVFEKKELILGKYGEEAETKLIYEIAENGGEKLVLRYDHTIPFIRFIQEKGIKKMKRYSIGKVYRRDNPNLSQGRYREFYQCDFDILGENNVNMMSESVIFSMISEILCKLGINDYVIIINDTDNLRTVLIDVLGIEPSKFKNICSTIDKLDKVQYNEIRAELAAKGLSMDQIDKLESILASQTIFNPSTKERLDKIYETAEIWGYRNKLQYNLSLARGLDYYNGIIFEVKCKGASSTDVFQTSVIAGGRYDGLVANTLIGFSVGVSRLMNYVETCQEVGKRYHLTTIGSIATKTKLQIIRWCRDNITKESPLTFSYDDDDKKMVKVISEQLKLGITDIIIIAENELKENKIILKNLYAKTQELIELT
jgi:histidyl-tRNA synthetase